MAVDAARLGRDSDKPVLYHLKWPYLADAAGDGFFWPGSPKRDEYLSARRLNPTIADAIYNANPGAVSGAVFVDEHFSRPYLAPPWLEQGLQDPEVKRFVDSGAMVIQAWDTAFSAETDSDYTVCVTVLLMPCSEYHNGEDEATYGPCEAHYDVLVLHVFREQIKWQDLTARAKRLYLTWQPQQILIEKRAYGVPLIEGLVAAGLPIEPMNPGPGKRARAIEGVGAGSVQGWFHQLRVRLPDHGQWVKPLIAEMKAFSGKRGGRDDQVDAMVYAVAHAIRTGGSSVRLPNGWEDAAAIDRRMGVQEYDNPDFNNPVTEGSCCRCRYFAGVIRSERLATNIDLTGKSDQHCTWHRRETAPLATCPDFSDVAWAELVVAGY